MDLDEAQADGQPVRGPHAEKPTALLPSPNPSLTIRAMRETMTDDEMVAALINCERNHMAEEFRHLRRLYGMDNSVAPAVGIPARTAAFTTPNPNPVAAPPLPLAVHVPAMANDGNAGAPAARQVVRRKCTRLTADDARFIYPQKHSKTAHKAALLGEEYGVTAKTVRDIWRRRTWGKATCNY